MRGMGQAPQGEVCRPAPNTLEIGGKKLAVPAHRQLPAAAALLAIIIDNTAAADVTINKAILQQGYRRSSKFGGYYQAGICRNYLHFSNIFRKSFSLVDCVRYEYHNGSRHP